MALNPFLTTDTHFVVIYGGAGRGGVVGDCPQIVWAARLSAVDAAACEEPGHAIDWREDGEREGDAAPPRPGGKAHFRIERFSADGRVHVARVTRETAAAFISAAEKMFCP